jgi:hypothetical protein
MPAKKTPAARKPSRSQVERAVRAHLAEQHCILFGKSYDIVSVDSRDECVRFLADIFEATNEHLRRR